MDKDDLLSGLILELRRGTIVLCVLSKLKNPTYGYQLINDLADGGISVEANTLYPLLRRLESQGLLQSEWRTDGAKPRKYYVTTEMGNEINLALKRHWKQTIQSMDKMWEGE
jgi:DNA-binding PadR family transcriptional regulator